MSSYPYLYRDPTSTGNRMSASWSCWVKRWGTEGTFWVFNGGHTKDNTTHLRWTNGGFLEFFDRQGTDSTTEQVRWDCQVLDPSNWHHILLSIDTTHSGNTGDERVKLYVNGVRLNRAPSSTLLNNSQDVNTPGHNQHFHHLNNSGKRHYFAALMDNSLLSTRGVNFCDCFYVDGVGLSPDVFGYYKDGYGITNAGRFGRNTDVRQGYWTPKKPSVIKAGIKQRGGFGPNGFYLPFNSNNNPGADFHCTPNTILKLKEDLAQPKAEIDGDPKVAVRDDPFGAYCQLALPLVYNGLVDGYGDYSHLIRGDGYPKTVSLLDDVKFTNEGTNFTASYYGSAARFDGTGDYLQVNEYEGGFDIGTKDFTVECWCFHTGGSDDTIISNTAGWTFTYGVAGYLRFYMANGSNQVDAVKAYVSNQWVHCVVERYNGVITFYQNGAAVGQHAYTHSIANSSTTTQIGKFHSGTVQYWDGYLQDLRVYIGVAKYKGGFDCVRPWVPQNFGTLQNGILANAWRVTKDAPGRNWPLLNDRQDITDDQGSGSNDVAAVYYNGGLSTRLDGDTSAAKGTMGVSSGKWYWEVRLDDNNSSPGVGIVAAGSQLNSFTGSGKGVSYEPRDDRFRKNGSNVYDGSNNHQSDGIIIGVALDKDKGIVRFFTDGNEQAGSPVTGVNDLAEVHLPDFWTWNDGQDNDFTVNFGQNPSFCGQETAGTYRDESGEGLFMYEPPAGHIAMCQKNMPAPAIPNPTDHFQPVLYEGDNSDGRKINLPFRPDMIWFKARSTVVSHVLCDVNRGVKSHLNPDSNGAESGTTGTPYLRSFDDDGFTLSDGSVSGGNTANRHYVAYCFRAGGNSKDFNIDGVGYDSLEEMPITLDYTSNGITVQKLSVNTKAGFSMIKYQGGPNGASDKIPHGLGKQCDFVMQKRLQSGHWICKHHWNDNNEGFLSDGDGAEFNFISATSQGGIANLTSSVHHIEPVAGTTNANNVNPNNNDCVAYMWAEIEGYSKFGQFYGNGDADGTFVYTGFKPAFVMIKNINSGRSWRMYDTAREPQSEVSSILYMDTNAAETATSHPVKMFANGFKPHGTFQEINEANERMLYVAFAESPYNYTNGAL